MICRLIGRPERGARSCFPRDIRSAISRRANCSNKSQIHNQFPNTKTRFPFLPARIIQIVLSDPTTAFNNPRFNNGFSTAAHPAFCLSALARMPVSGPDTPPLLRRRFEECAVNRVPDRVLTLLPRFPRQSASPCGPQKARSAFRPRHRLPAAPCWCCDEPTASLSKTSRCRPWVLQLLDTLKARGLPRLPRPSARLNVRRMNVRTAPSCWRNGPESSEQGRKPAPLFMIPQ